VALAAVLGPLALSAAAVLAGCSTARTPYRATPATCYAFSVQALSQQHTVSTVPRACAGLSHEQVDLAVARAVHTVVGPHGKVAGRRLAHREIGYLARLIQTAQPAGPAPQARTGAGAAASGGTGAGAGPGRSPSLPLGLAALAAWAVTAAAGAWLIAGWLVRGGLRNSGVRGTRADGVPRAVVAGHFTLALAGLGVWIAFLVSGAVALAWTAVVLILVIAGLGMATLAGGLPSAPPAGGLDPPVAPLPVAAPSAAAPSAAARQRPAVAATAVLDIPAGARKPLLVIVLHGALAATTILLVVLAAAGAA
jgi:hypothetical protein